MANRLPMYKLVPATGGSKFSSALLRPANSLVEKVSHLRNVYAELAKEWNDQREDAPRFAFAASRTRELLVGVDNDNATHNFKIANEHAGKSDYKTANVYLSYALLKIGTLLNQMTKKAYGYDVSGQVMEPGERESRSPNLWDKANSPKNNQTSPNPANSGIDAEAEDEFKELMEEKHHHVEWPARTR